MTLFVAIVFALTYAGMAIGRIPGLKVDRAGIAMVAAVLLVAAGAVPAGAAAESVHFPTLLLLAGLMILSARVRASGLYDALSYWIARRAGSPKMLLAGTVAVGGALSAVLVNDIVVFAMTPLLCAGLAARRLDPRPFLFGLAAASNAGSAATLIGNPQNVLIGQVGDLGFWSYLAIAAIPAAVSLVLVYLCIAVVWARVLKAAPSGPAAREEAFPHVTVDPWASGIGLGGLVLLLCLFATPLPREISALIVAAVLVLSRHVSSRQLLGEVDVPLLLLFASLFVVTGAFSATGFAQGAVVSLADSGLLPDRLATLAGFALVASNSIGNVPAVVLLLEVWEGIPQGVLIGLAILSTLAGNLLLVGSLANLIVAERAETCGVRLTFADHARGGVPIALLSMFFAAAWLWGTGFVPL